ncbi:MAG TPA: methionyl-tRNA formyltransferase [Burkholderiaceae bacterium]|nr:methionyl-tRNA formyltransferase [Burkholderiaceae bacterium]
MRVAFAGTPEFAAQALRGLLAAGFEVPLVLTQPDRPAGRGLKLQASAVKQVALAHAIAVQQPRSLRLDGKFADDAREARAAVEACGADAMVVAAYGLILPAWVLQTPRLGCLNIHASLLPRWRGAAPIQRAIEAGDACTGVTIMQMDEGLDTGPMLLSEAVPIRGDDTAASLHDALAALGARLIVDALDRTARAVLQPRAQPSEGATYARKIDKAEARIDWHEPAAAIERRVRAFDPAPGCHFEHEGEAVKLWRAALAPAFDAVPGTFRVDSEGMRVACGDGAALELLELQRPGGRRVPVTAFLAGRAAR